MIAAFALASVLMLPAAPLRSDTLPASPPLAPNHWAVDAARRAEALGLADGYQPAQRGVPRAAAAAALRQAAYGAVGTRWSELTNGWLDRFIEEFPEYAGRATQTEGVRGLGSRLAAGYVDRSGRLAPANGLAERQIPPAPLPGEDGAVLDGVVALAWSSGLAAVAEPRVGPGDEGIVRWDVTAALGRLGVSVGEEPIGYGYGRGGGIVLSGVPVRRIEAQTLQPFAWPGILKLLGPTSLHTFLAEISEQRHPGDPYFWGMRVGIQPHPRLTLALNRAAILGGDSVTTPFTARNFGRMLVGYRAGDLSNQIASAEIRYRLPTEGVIPLTLYGEWGTEDSAGAYRDVPGTLVGIFLPGLPFLPTASLGGEYTRFAPFCCGNPPWYFSVDHPGGWVLADEPLGHPLGGEGWEALLYGSADLGEAIWRLDGRLFLRDRGREGFDTFLKAGNLFAPDRAGRSVGAAAQALWRASPAAEVTLSYAREEGDGWREQRLIAAFGVLF
ncbi:MAG: capsule assembly Wzi family protein [Longimicrobiaceae bacterium]